MTIEDDAAILVFHDVVSVQAVAGLIEPVFALDTLEAPDCENRAADLLGVGTSGLIDGPRSLSDLSLSRNYLKRIPT